MTILLDSGKVARWMAAVICGLVMAHLVMLALAWRFADVDFLGVDHFFDLDAEANLPTFYESLAMLLTAVILAAIARLERADLSTSRYWLGLAIVFVLLAVDEAATIHEMVSQFCDSLFVTSGFFYYSWVIPYALALVLISLLYVRFILALPIRTKFLFLAAGSIFVSGALGLEACSARYDELSGGVYDQTAAMMAVVEETLEMAGIALFVYALLSYAEQRHGGLEIAIGSSRPDV